MPFPPSSVFAQADGGVFSFLHTMDGPDFLFVYAGWFVVSFVAVLVFRWSGRDSAATTLIGFLCYESLGVVRIIVGSAYGMHRWGFLIAMMIVGGLVFFLRAE